MSQYYNDYPVALCMVIIPSALQLAFFCMCTIWNIYLYSNYCTDEIFVFTETPYWLYPSSIS